MVFYKIVYNIRNRAETCHVILNKHTMLLFYIATVYNYNILFFKKSCNSYIEERKLSIIHLQTIEEVKKEYHRNVNV